MRGPSTIFSIQASEAEQLVHCRPASDQPDQYDQYIRTDDYGWDTTFLMFRKAIESAGHVLRDESAPANRHRGMRGNVYVQEKLDFVSETVMDHLVDDDGRGQSYTDFVRLHMAPPPGSEKTAGFIPRLLAAYTAPEFESAAKTGTESAAHGFIVSILSVVDPHTLEVVSAQVDAARRLFDRLLEQHGLEPSTAPECDDSSRR